MRYEEALWINEVIKKYHRSMSPLINFGSSTEAYTERVSHIAQYVIEPLHKYNVKVSNLDIKKASGVDIVGDLNDKSFLKQLQQHNFNSVLCANLLEHILFPEEVLKTLEIMTKPGGYIILTVPRIYPYHADPIDTKYRPAIEELVALLPGCTLLDGRYIKSKGSHFQSLKTKKALTRYFLKMSLPFKEFQVWKKKLPDLKNLFKQYEVTCVVFQKK